MPKITLDEFCAHWVEGKYVTKMPNKLERNVFDFVTLAGDYSRQQFQASFSSGGFCGGSRWAPRTSRWGKRFTHPVMNDSGAWREVLSTRQSLRILSDVVLIARVYFAKGRITIYSRTKKVSLSVASEGAAGNGTATMQPYTILTLSLGYIR